MIQMIFVDAEHAGKRKAEKAKALVRVKMEYPFQSIKQQFGYTKVSFRDLAKRTPHNWLRCSFCRSCEWLRHFLRSEGVVCP